MTAGQIGVNRLDAPHHGARSSRRVAIGSAVVVLGLAVALYTRPFRTGAATAAVAAIGTVLLAFRVPGISPGLVSAASTLITGLLMLGVTSPQTMSLMLLHRALPEHAGPKKM